MNAILWVWNWTMEAKWRTWLLHGVLAFAFSGVFGAWSMMIAYGWGEGKETLQELSLGIPIDPLDRFMDFAVPFVGAGFASLIGWGA
jgi:drug/metabolite transporter (DMT)-like permease